VLRLPASRASTRRVRRVVLRVRGHAMPVVEDMEPRRSRRTLSSSPASITARRTATGSRRSRSATSTCSARGEPRLALRGCHPRFTTARCSPGSRRDLRRRRAVARLHVHRKRGTRTCSRDATEEGVRTDRRGS
jgi:hypothetical protein